MTSRIRSGRALLVIALVAMVASLSAQRGGGGGGGFGPGGQPAPLPRMAALTKAFTLDDAQKKKVHDVLDDGYKDAGALRDALNKNRDALAKLVESGKDQPALEVAIQNYAKQAAAMAEAEVKALAGIVKILTPDQKANDTAMLATQYMMRGIFYGKKWDMIPDVRFY